MNTQEHLSDEYAQWLSQSLDKQKRSSIVSEAPKKVVKKIHIGPMYVDDILHIAEYLEDKGVSFEFRIIDRTLLYSMDRHAILEKSSITKNIFKSRNDFEKHIAKSEIFDLVFLDYLCIGYGIHPTNIRWDAADGCLHVIQQFSEMEIPDLEKTNIVVGLIEYVRSKRESFWFRRESSLYYYSVGNVLALLAVHYKSWYIGAAWFLVFVVLGAKIKPAADKTFGNAWGILSKKEDDPMYLKKKRRVKLLSKPVIVVSAAIFGTVINNLAKLIIDQVKLLLI